MYAFRLASVSLDLHTSSFEPVLVFYYSKILRMHPSTSLIPALESAIPPRTRRPILFSGQWYLETKVWAQVCSLLNGIIVSMPSWEKKTGKEIYVYTHRLCVYVYINICDMYMYIYVCKHTHTHTDAYIYLYLYVKNREFALTILNLKPQGSFYRSSFT